MSRCEDCANYEAGSASDANGVCLKLTDWEARELWWVGGADRACMLLAERRAGGR